MLDLTSRILFQFQAESELGTVDMLVNAAGFSVSGRFEEIPIGDFKVKYIFSIVFFMQKHMVLIKALCVMVVAEIGLCCSKRLFLQPPFL